MTAVEMCLPTEGPVWAHYGRRTIDRKSTRRQPLHAVGLWASLAVRRVIEERELADGTVAVTVLDLVEAECGTDCVIEPTGPWMGPWGPDSADEPDRPINRCAKCAKLVAGQMPMPAEPVMAPVVELAPRALSDAA